MNLTEVKSVLDQAAQTETDLKKKIGLLEYAIREGQAAHSQTTDKLRAAMRAAEDMQEEMSCRSSLTDIASAMGMRYALDGALLDEYRSLITNLPPETRSPLVNAAHSLIVLMNANARETYAYLVRRGWKRTSDRSVLVPPNGDIATDFTRVMNAMKAQCLEDCMRNRDSLRRFMKHGLAGGEEMVAGAEIKAGQAVAEINGLAVPIVNKPLPPYDPGSLIDEIVNDAAAEQEAIDASFVIVDDDDVAEGGPNNFDPAVGESETVEYAFTQPETIGTVREPAIADLTPTLPMSGAQQWLLDGYRKLAEPMQAGVVRTHFNKDNDVVLVSPIDGFAMTVANFNEGQKLAIRLSKFNQELAEQAARTAVSSVSEEDIEKLSKASEATPEEKYSGRGVPAPGAMLGTGVHTSPLAHSVKAVKLMHEAHKMMEEHFDKNVPPSAEPLPSIELAVRQPDRVPAIHVDVPPGYEPPSKLAAATRPTTDVRLSGAQQRAERFRTTVVGPGVQTTQPDTIHVIDTRRPVMVPHGLPEGGLGGRHPGIEAGGMREATPAEIAAIAAAAPAAKPLEFQKGRKVSRLVSDGAGQFLIPKESVQKLADKDAEQMQ